MNSLHKKYAELLSLTQLYLLREYQLNDKRSTDPATLNFFKQKMGNQFITPKVKVQSSVTSNTLRPLSDVPIQASHLPPNPNPNPFPPETQPEPLPPNKPEPLPPTKPEPFSPQPLPPTTKPEPLKQDPKPPVIQDKTKKETLFNFKLHLEPLEKSDRTQDVREFWKLFPQLFPHIGLSDTIPDDAIAQKLNNVWRQEQTAAHVLILSFHDEPKHQLFLKNLAKAISLRLAPTQVLSISKVETENSWEKVLQSSELRLIIANDYDLYLQPSLMKFYREIPQQGKHFLHHIPLLLLSDLSLYLKEPQLKLLLWRAICNEFVAIQPPAVRR